MTETAPASTAPPGPRRLSPAGRERFGERLAGQLWASAGGVAVLIIAPGLTGTVVFPRLFLLAMGLVAALLALTGSMIHFLTVERRDEASESRDG